MFTDLRTTFMRLATLMLAVFCSNLASASDIPLYKPSSRAPEPIDISSNAYGHSVFAPDALGIGEVAPEFRLPLSGGGFYSLEGRNNASPLVIIFYRGHW